MGYFFILLLLLINPFLCHASVVLNEIYPAPVSGEYEWVELYNTGNEFVDISQYQLVDADGHKIKIATTSAPPYGYIVSTSSAVLNNSGDTVLLKNNLGDVLEVATYSGTFDFTKAFVKCPDGGNNWFSLNFMTKNASNETACLSLTPIPTLTPIVVPTEVPIPTTVPINLPTSVPPVDNDSIFISEVYPYPNKDEHEWIELYNSGDNEVILTDWKIDDIEAGGSSPHAFSLTLPAKQYGAVSFSSSLFNNDQDSVRLLNFSGIEKDSMEYTNAKQGFSFGRQSNNSDTYCLQLPSLNNQNNSCYETQPTKVQTQTPTKKIQSVANSMTTSPITSPSKLTKRVQSTVPVKETAPSVLGESTRVSGEPVSFFPCLSLTATLYALLTLVSVFAKMKYAENP